MLPAFWPVNQTAGQRSCETKLAQQHPTHGETETKLAPQAPPIVPARQSSPSISHFQAKPRKYSPNNSPVLAKPRQNSPSNSPFQAKPRKNSPSKPKNAEI